MNSIERPGLSILAKNSKYQYLIAEWAQYELKGEASTNSLTVGQTEREGAAPGNVKNEIEAAKLRIANVAGVSVEAVRISIDF